MQDRVRRGVIRRNRNADIQDQDICLKFCERGFKFIAQTQGSHHLDIGALAEAQHIAIHNTLVIVQNNYIDFSTWLHIFFLSPKIAEK